MNKDLKIRPFTPLPVSTNLPLLFSLFEKEILLRVVYLMLSIFLLSFFIRTPQCSFGPLTAPKVLLPTAKYNGQLSSFIFLDLSAASDTDVHSILLRTLSSPGFQETAFSWSSSLSSLLVLPLFPSF